MSGDNPKQARFGCAVLVIGESIVDIVQRSDHAVEYPGGSPANVAFGVARLGVQTALCTQFGTDSRGELLRQHLEGAGVRVLPMQGQQSTSTARAVIDAAGAAEYDFDIAWTLADAPETAGYRVVHTGSIASFLAPGAAAVRRAIGEARASALVTYDPNIRPELLGSRSDTVRAVEEFAALAHVVKLSDDDARWLYPDQGISDVLQRLIELGAELAVMTMGGEGAVLRTRSTEITVPAVAVTVVDTIGAGDAFMSALIAAVLQIGSDTGTANLDAESLRRVGKYAVAAAAITVSRSGALPPIAAELPPL